MCTSSVRCRRNGCGIFIAMRSQCLVPSSGYEVLGLIILEAYLQRTPVIAHDLGALTEVVEQSQGGLLYRNAGRVTGGDGAIAR